MALKGPKKCVVVPVPSSIELVTPLVQPTNSVSKFSNSSSTQPAQIFSHAEGVVSRVSYGVGSGVGSRVGSGVGSRVRSGVGSRVGSDSFLQTNGIKGFATQSIVPVSKKM